jgi:uncharacterized protein (UPF0261 family)
MDVGVLGDPWFVPNISRSQVAEAAGADIRALIAKAHRGEAIAAMSTGAAVLAQRLSAAGELDAILGLGGGAGTSIATAAMRSLPFGIPKVMFSTMSGGDVKEFVGIKDIVMFPTIVDICGLNHISRKLLTQLAGAVCGMMESRSIPLDHAPLLGVSMFGNTTIGVGIAKQLLESAGYEVLVFHANGIGGKTLDDLVQSGLMSGVLDLTTTELADELVGGVLSAGPGRLEAGAQSGKPVVIAPGCLDMVNFWAPETVPERFRARLFYSHNPNVTLMRTSPEENVLLGRMLAEKLNPSSGPVEVYLPLRGLSVISAPGGPFWWPEADRALFDSLKYHLSPRIFVREIDANINDAEFATAAAMGLLAMLKGTTHSDA